MTPRVLVCAPRPPEYDRESGSRRIWDHIAHFREAGWAVTFLVENGRGAERTLEELRQRGVMVLEGLTERTVVALGLGRYDLAVVAFYHLAERLVPLLRDVSPATRIAIDSIDVHLLREARRALRADPASPSPPRLPAEFGANAARELNAYAAADAVLTVSEKEAAFVNDLLGRDRHAVAVADAEPIARSRVPFDDRRGILFVGNFRHPPNGEAADFLLDEVLPLLPDDLLAEHPLRIVGTQADVWARSRRRLPEGVVVVGWVPSLGPYFERSRISVVPLLHGAGTKRKVIQALMAGLPTVTTPIGAEGLDLVDGRDALIAADPHDLARSACRLLDEEPLWERIAAGGRATIERRHTPEVAAAQLRDLVARLVPGAGQRPG